MGIKSIHNLEFYFAGDTAFGYYSYFYYYMYIYIYIYMYIYTAYIAKGIQMNKESNQWITLLI